MYTGTCWVLKRDNQYACQFMFIELNPIYFLLNFAARPGATPFSNLQFFFLFLVSTMLPCVFFSTRSGVASKILFRDL